MTNLPMPRVRVPSLLPEPPEQAGAGMVDTFGRVARDLRVSVTDRCNLRCTYCMPAEGLPWMPKTEMLTDEELLRVVGVFVGLGVRQVRLTGASRSCAAASSTSSRASPPCARALRWR